jgi:hypothetical protein
MFSEIGADERQTRIRFFIRTRALGLPKPWPMFCQPARLPV